MEFLLYPIQLCHQIKQDFTFHLRKIKHSNFIAFSRKFTITGIAEHHFNLHNIFSGPFLIDLIVIIQHNNFGECLRSFIKKLKINTKVVQNNDENEKYPGIKIRLLATLE